MLETFLILNNKFLFLRLFQGQSCRGAKCRIHNLFSSKLIGILYLGVPVQKALF